MWSTKLERRVSRCKIFYASRRTCTASSSQGGFHLTPFFKAAPAGGLELHNVPVRCFSYKCRALMMATGVVQGAAAPCANNSCSDGFWCPHEPCSSRAESCDSHQRLPALVQLLGQQDYTTISAAGGQSGGLLCFLPSSRGAVAPGAFALRWLPQQICTGALRSPTRRKLISFPSGPIDLSSCFGLSCPNSQPSKPPRYLFIGRREAPRGRTDMLMKCELLTAAC